MKQTTLKKQEVLTKEDFLKEGVEESGLLRVVKGYSPNKKIHHR
jgi:hypothetical protein